MKFVELVQCWAETQYATVTKIKDLLKSGLELEAIVDGLKREFPAATAHELGDRISSLNGSVEEIQRRDDVMLDEMRKLTTDLCKLKEDVEVNTRGCRDLYKKDQFHREDRRALTLRVLAIERREVLRDGPQSQARPGGNHIWMQRMVQSSGGKSVQTLCRGCLSNGKHGVFTADDQTCDPVSPWDSWVETV